MTEPLRESTDERLTRLRLATELLGPSSGFSERVLLRVGVTETGFWTELARFSPRFLPAACVAAALTVAWAYWTQRTVDDLLATSSETVELEW